ncbi:hypothetical protein FNJ84_17780 [Paracoccus sp. M683]|uniref:hypothetical protein n=1 Tax=Paracoccus sp. M683 TaxID=2594268 RepID=UPI001180F0C2|nr:hypothetical protein [Paracoccus sp. M683]TRW94943.1 hypothetical protein FNJ84_17780 [Paracoccus sp. M683]
MIALLLSRAGLLALAVAGVAALGGWVYWQGGKDARREADGLRDHITTRERIDNALDRPAGCSWLDRLQSACE